MSIAGEELEGLTGFDTSGIADLVGTFTDGDEVNDLLGDAVATAFRVLTARGQEARGDALTALTISGLGRCVREGAYRLGGVEPSDPRLLASGENRQANMGSAIDAALVPTLAELLGGQAHVPVTLRLGDDEVTGTADLVLPRIVVDLKSARQSRMVGAIAGGPYDNHRRQVIGYAIGLVQAGTPIDWVSWLYLDRETGDEHLITEPLTLELQVWALRRAWEIQGWKDRPHMAPRTERGPGLSMACDSCGWLRKCWGTNARPHTAGPQRRLGRTVGDVARLLLRYAALGREGKAIEEERELIKTIFMHGSRPGNYGDLSWGLTRGYEETDAKAAADLLRQHGLTVPTRTRAGSLRVAPARKDAR